MALERQDSSPKQTGDSVYRIGTAGWSYDDWEGVFYPAKRSSRFRALTYYRRYFNMVEVDATFYRVMPARLAENWCRDVADHRDFLFSLKLWQGLTHERPESLPRNEVNEIRAMCRALADRGRLGALLLQFPWSFQFSEENLSYLARLLDAFRDYPCAVEVRHSNWQREEYRNFLRERSVAFCNIDQPAMRDCLPPTAISTAPFSYLRLHGRNRANWFRENTQPGERYDYLYSAKEIEDLARLARALAEQTSRVMVTGNNHFRGQAAANALMLRAALEGKAERVPPSLIKAFPDLSDLPVEHREAEEPLTQPDLFDA